MKVKLEKLIQSYSVETTWNLNNYIIYSVIKSFLKGIVMKII